MAVDLADFVDPLLREVRPPGSTLFAGVTETTWVGYLSDAFWEARLDGFLEGYTVNADEDTVESVDVGTPDISRKDMSLVVLYAGIKILRNKILNMNTGFRAKAGSVEFEQQNSATMLVEMLKQLKATKDRILEALDDDDQTAVLMIDAFSTRLYSLPSYYGSTELTG